MARRGKVGGTFSHENNQNRFGKNNSFLGASGERYLHKVFEAEGIADDYDVWSSLRMPHKPGQKRYNTDIDFAVSSGDKLILIDAKKWSAKAPYWSFLGMPFKGFAPLEQNGAWKPLSKNMQMAVNRFREALPNAQVSAMVVFVPVNKSGQVPPSVGLLIWPGFIRSFLPASAVRFIKRKLGEGKTTSPKIDSALSRLISR